MSQPASRITHPFEVLYHPTLGPEAKRAILAFWASNPSAGSDQLAPRRPGDANKPVPLDQVLAALRALDGLPTPAALH